MLITYKEGGKTVFPRYQQRPMHPLCIQEWQLDHLIHTYRMTPPMNPMMRGSMDHLQGEVADYYQSY